MKALPTNPSHEPVYRWGPALLVFLVTFLAFCRAVQFDFVCDDWIVLVHNTRLNPPTWGALGYYWTHIAWNLYMPVTCTAWALLVRLGYVTQPDQYGNHLNPTVFHLMQILLHAAVTVGLYRLLRQITGSPWAAAAGALVFGVHPIQVEAVCYIGALNNPLLGLFSILALSDYLDAVATGKVRAGVYCRGMFFLILALLCKPAAVVVPAIAGILDWTVHRRKLRRVCMSVLPWLVAAAPCVIWTKRFQLGTIAANFAPVAFRPIVSLDAVGFYVWKILFPFQLAADYGRSPRILYAHPWMALLGLVAVALLVVAWLVRGRFPILAAAILVFMVALIPNSGIFPFDFQQYSTVADRYVYLAMIGPALAVAWGLSLIANGKRAFPIRVLSCLLLTVLFLMTVRQSGYWQNDRTLFGHAVDVNPQSWMGRENLAFGLLRTDPAAAVEQCRISLEINPNYSPSHLTMGYAYLGLGKKALALAEIRRAVEMNPTDAQSRKALAQTLDLNGDQARAIAEYKQCLALGSEDAQVHCNLASLLAEMGNLPEAISHYRTALQIDPDLSAAQDGLARALRQMNGGAK